MRSDEPPSDRSAGRCGWAAARIAGIYIGVSLLYIVVSDLIAGAMAGPRAETRTVHTLQTVQTIKGIAFVLITGAMLWVLIWRYARSLVAVTERLAASEELHRRLFNDSPVAFVLVRGRTIEAVNSKARNLLGDSVVGQDLGSLSPDEAERFASTVLSMASSPGPERHPEFAIRGREGRPLSAEIDATSAWGGTIQVGLHDVTERRQMEKVVRQAQKMEAVGSLAARMTHEFNNVLTAVLGHAAMAKRALGEDEDARRLISRIESVGRHAAGLTRSMLSLYHQSPSIRRPCELAGLLEEAAELIRGVLSSAVRLDMDTRDVRGVYCNCDPAQAKQALLNLAVNARDAMPQGGVLSIRTSICADRAVIEVRDTGVGIPDEVIQHIFTPLFTTKPPGKGTGLGLAVTKGIIEEHGGTIEVTSQPGTGTTFTISLPTCARIEPADRGHSDADGQLVILGEDNPAVRGVLAESLRLAGYCVVTANDGPGVVDTVRRNADSVTAIVLDVGLPGMSGLECLEQIRSSHPGLPCVLMTGGDEPALAGSLKERTLFLGKPFSGNELLDALSDLLPRSGFTAGAGV